MGFRHYLETLSGNKRCHGLKLQKLAHRVGGLLGHGKDDKQLVHRQATRGKVSEPPLSRRPQGHVHARGQIDRRICQPLLQLEDRSTEADSLEKQGGEFADARRALEDSDHQLPSEHDQAAHQAWGRPESKIVRKIPL